MKKVLKCAVIFSALGLAGCVAVPAYDPPYVHAPRVIAAPPAVVVRPAIYGHYGYFSGAHWRHWR